MQVLKNTLTECGTFILIIHHILFIQQNQQTNHYDTNLAVLELIVIKF